RVLDGALPALPGHRLGLDLEDQAEVRPHHRADPEADHLPGHVEAVAAGLDALGAEHDRDGVRHGVEEPGQLPPDEHADQIRVSLDDAGEADQLAAERTRGLAPHACTSSSASSSKLRPVAAMNASSSVSAP